TTLMSEPRTVSEPRTQRSGVSDPAATAARSARRLATCAARTVRGSDARRHNSIPGATMKVMVIVKASKDSEAGIMPSQQLLAEMGKFNEELAKAGILLAGEGLHPTSKGARVRFSGKERTVIDGPFAETKELIAGFWLWKVKSMPEAIAWLKRCPNPHNEEA